MRVWYAAPMRFWRDVGEALNEAIAGDWWDPTRDRTAYYYRGPGGSAAAYEETPAGAAKRRAEAAEAIWGTSAARRHAQERWDVPLID